MIAINELMLSFVMDVFLPPRSWLYVHCAHDASWSVSVIVSTVSQTVMFNTPFQEVPTDLNLGRKSKNFRQEYSKFLASLRESMAMVSWCSPFVVRHPLLPATRYCHITCPYAHHPPCLPFVVQSCSHSPVFSLHFNYVPFPGGS